MGLAKWGSNRQERTGCNGADFLSLTDKILRKQFRIAVPSHRRELLKAVSELTGFLERYILDVGQPVHTSATCVLILADDRHTELPNGQLKRVAVKCMIDRVQFETEVSMRDGLDQEYVMGALRVHVPTDYKTTAFEWEEEASAQASVLAIEDKEPEPEADEERVCEVCFEKGSYRISTGCGHTYCGSCIKYSLEAILSANAERFYRVWPKRTRAAAAE